MRGSPSKTFSSRYPPNPSFFFFFLGSIGYPNLRCSLNY